MICISYGLFFQRDYQKLWTKYRDFLAGNGNKGYYCSQSLQRCNGIMTLIVQKFGGTSLANVDRIKSVAQRVIAEIEQGHQVVVVVSAMAGVTNQLVGWSHQCVNHHLTASEYDVVVSSGEQVTAGLMALALNDSGIKTRSWLSWQLPIKTDHHHKNASITAIDTQGLQETLDRGEVAVVAGFQGIGPDGRLTTVGRGGSDYTAVSLAVAMKATRCDIYTDVDGVFTADPRLITNARKLDHLSYQDVLDLAGHGAKVLQPQSIESAQQGNVPIRVLSSFNNNEGTTVSSLSQTNEYIGVTSRRDRSMFDLELDGEVDLASKAIKKALVDACVEIDYNSRFEPNGDRLTILVARDDYEEAESTLNQCDAVKAIKTFSRVAQVAVVGKIGHKAAEIAKKIQISLDDKEIPVYEMKADERAVSIIMPADRMEEAVKVLHNEYILQQPSNVKVA
jgi:aspartate kinase